VELERNTVELFVDKTLDELFVHITLEELTDKVLEVLRELDILEQEPYAG
jgi:hypothetical protein